jgi:hypothetical protein
MKNSDRARFVLFAVFSLALSVSSIKAQVRELQTDRPPPPPRPMTSVNRDIPFSDWYALTPDDQSFKVKFPIKPVYEESTNPAVRIVIHSYSVNLTPRHFFLLDVVEGPSGFRSDLTAQAGIDSISRSSSVLGAKEISRSKFEKQTTCTGSEILLATPADGISPQTFVHARVFYSGSRVYVLQHVGRMDGELSRNEWSNFLDSIEIKGGCSGLTAPVTAASQDETIGFIDGKKDEATGWRLINREDEGFSVTMPGLVKHVSRQAQVQPIALTHQTFSAESETARFVVTIVGSYPKGLFSGRMVHDIALDARVREIEKEFTQLKFKLTFVKNLDVNGFPGREYTAINDAGDRIARLQIYSTPKRSLSFLGMDTPGEAAEKHFATFFDSIKIDTSEP